MQDLIEQMIDYLKAIWIKRRYIIVMSWLICPVGWYTISKMDDIYEANARVFADTQSILGPLLKGLTVEQNPENQIATMVNTLLNRTNLERITRMTDLDVHATTPQQYEALISRLRNNIIIRRTSRKDNIFIISFEDKDPEIARAVVNSVLTVFIENTLGDNRTDADSAQKFLVSQIREYENRLTTAEARLTEFKQKYRDVLPNESGGYYNQLQKEKGNLSQAQLELEEVENSVIQLQNQLNLSAQNAQNNSDVISDNTTVSSSFDGRIKVLEANLDGLLLRFTEKHPDVTEAQRLLASLYNSRKAELDSYYESLSKNSDGDGNNLNALNSNPVYQEMRIKVNELNAQAASLRVRVSNFSKRVEVLENKIHIIPEIEAELTALNRGYNITKAKYEALLGRNETAQIAQQADKSTSNINFRVIDPPRTPSTPIGPKRMLLTLGVTFLGFGAGIGLSLLFSQINPVVTSRNQVTKETGIPVFGVISATESLGLQQWHKRKRLIFIISNSLLITLLVCFIMYSRYPEKFLAPLKGML
jgi:polysaccharide chain length determinant protein (PEP-CTERM system associated)